MSPTVPTLSHATDVVRREAAMTVGRVTNGLRILGGLDLPATGCTPSSVVWTDDRATMRRYHAGMEPGRQPVLLVPSLINGSHVWDLRPGDSFVEGLLAAGHDVFLIDWGRPDQRDAWNTVSTYVDGYLPSAYQRLRELTGARPVVMGHCLGGVLCLLWAATTEDPPEALITLATPTNLSEMGMMYHLTRAGRLDPESVLDNTGNVSPRAVLAAFRMLQPLGEVVSYVTLWDRLHDRQAGQAIRALTLWAHHHVPFPGQVFVELVRHFQRENALATGQVFLDGRPRKLSDIRCAFLNVYGTHDVVTPPESVVPLTELVGSPNKETVGLSAGHVGLLVGGTACKKTLPTVIGWLTDVRAQQ